MRFVKIIAKIATCWILDKKLRKKLRYRVKTRLYGQKVFQRAKAIGENLYLGNYCSVNKNTYLGHDVHMNGLQIHGGGKVTIGNYFHSGVECLIIAQNHNYEGKKIPYDEAYVYKDIEIGDFVWLGSRVMILPGTKIGEGAIIQGGSVVHGEIPPYAIAGGNPAKVFKYRDIEHFKELKDKGEYYSLYSE